MTDEAEFEVEDVKDAFIADGEVMVPDWVEFSKAFQCLAVLNREGQLYLLTKDTKGKFVAIDELVKRPATRLKAAT